MALLIGKRVKVLGIALIAFVVCGFKAWLYRDMIVNNIEMALKMLALFAIIILAGLIVAAGSYIREDKQYTYD